ncbi:MAG: hypothetical protein KAI43_13995 [Candidatus Aureabacteria bacterium]|nr:hypothetical protein [Candidatus Auribacterota bacterium]
MNIEKLTLTKKHLDLLPEKERVFFIQLAHLSNEITVLTKLLILSNSTSKTEVINKAYAMQSSLIARMSIGKLYEAWRLLKINFFASKLSKKYEPKLAKDGLHSLQKLKKYFGKNNLISDIRNNFSFHYPSFDEIKKQLDAIPDETEFQLFLGNAYANNNYYIAEEILFNAMLNYVKKTTLQDAMVDIFDDLSQVSDWFILFAQHCMTSFLEEFMGEIKDTLKTQTLNVKSQGNIYKLKIPYFVDVKIGKA